jgi:putative transposase
VEKAAHPESSLSALCRNLTVSRSGYYSWLTRQEGTPGRRQEQNLRLLREIEQVHAEFGYYGSPRVHEELLARGHHVGRHRVARLMRSHEIAARRGKIKTRPRAAPPVRRPEVNDLVERDFHADVENALWFTDLTMIRTGQGWLYAAIVEDAFSREVISYTVADRETPRTAWTALEQAIRLRRPPRGCIIHSDRGYQFTAHEWFSIANKAGLRVSIGAKKTAVDNAAMESWFSSFKSEELYPKGQPRTRQEARRRLFRYIWEYNTKRRHSTLGYVPPRTYATESSTCP